MNKCRCGKFESLASFSSICNERFHTEELCGSRAEHQLLLLFVQNLAKGSDADASYYAGELLRWINNTEGGPMPKKERGIADAKFEEIIEEAVAQAGKVDCPASQYRTNLSAWISTIKSLITASEEMDGT